MNMCPSQGTGYCQEKYTEGNGNVNLVVDTTLAGLFCFCCWLVLPGHVCVGSVGVPVDK